MAKSQSVQVQIDTRAATKMLNDFTKTLSKVADQFKKAQPPADKFNKTQESLRDTLQRNIPLLRNLPFINVTNGFMAINEAVGLVIKGFTVLIKTITRLTNAAIDQVRAEQKLSAVLKATGNAAGFSNERLQEFADTLQETSQFADERYIEAMSRVATFTNITGDEFIRATKLSADLAATIGSSVPQAALQLGRALNDTTYGLNLLAQSGINVEKSQKELIRAMEASGQQAKAQQMLLFELESRLGGVNSEIRDSGVGAWLALGNQLNDTSQEFGRLVADGIRPATEWMREHLRLIEAGAKGGAYDSLQRSIEDATRALIEYAEGWKLVFQDIARLRREARVSSRGVQPVGGFQPGGMGRAGVPTERPLSPAAAAEEARQRAERNRLEMEGKRAERRAEQNEENELEAEELRLLKEQIEARKEAFKEQQKQVALQAKANAQVEKARKRLVEPLLKELDPLRQTRQELEGMLSAATIFGGDISPSQLRKLIQGRIDTLREEGGPDIGDFTIRGFSARFEDSLSMNRRIQEAAASKQDKIIEVMSRADRKAQEQRGRLIELYESFFERIDELGDMV